MAKLSDLKIDKVRFTLPLWSNGEIVDMVEFYNPTKELTDELEKKILVGEEIDNEYKIDILLPLLTNLEVDMTALEVLTGYYNEILERILIEIDNVVMDVTTNVLVKLKGYQALSDDKKESIAEIVETLGADNIREMILNAEKQLDIETENLN